MLPPLLVHKQAAEGGDWRTREWLGAGDGHIKYEIISHIERPK